MPALYQQRETMLCVAWRIQGGGGQDIAATASFDKLPDTARRQRDQ